MRVRHLAPGRDQITGALEVTREEQRAGLAGQPDPLQRAHATHDRPVADQRMGLVYLVQAESAGPGAGGAGHGALLDGGGTRKTGEVFVARKTGSRAAP